MRQLQFRTKLKRQALTTQPFTPDSTLVDDTVKLVDDTTALVGGQTSIIDSIKLKVLKPQIKTGVKLRR